MREVEPNPEERKSVFPTKASLLLKLWNHLTPERQEQFRREDTPPIISIERVSVITPNLTNELYRLAAQLSRNIQRETFGSVLQNVIVYPNGHLFIARENLQQILGMLTMMTYPLLTGKERTWIEDVIVDQNARSKGIGEKLLQRAIDEARCQGIQQINLTSNPTRVAANNLYQKLGFQKYDTNLYRYPLE